jgi:Tol biopolymer transport system component
MKILFASFCVVRFLRGDFRSKRRRQITLSAVFETFARFVASLSPDGKNAGLSDQRYGTSQVWLIDLDKGEPRQATKFEDNVSFVRWLPDGKNLIFGKAVGGNENTQFFPARNRRL